MRKLALPALLVLFLLSFSALPSGAAGAIVNKKIGLDPGHGGSEIGAAPYECKDANQQIYDVVYEKDINVAVAHVLKDLLIAEGVNSGNIILTRSDDSTVSLSGRVDIANNAGVDVLVSIHHNGSSNPDANWTETYYSQPDDKPLAEETYKTLSDTLGLGGGGAKRSPGFTLTRKPNMPSTLTEAYFATNPGEATNFCGIPETDFNAMLMAYKQVPRVQQEAAALKQGLVNYFDKNTGGGKGKSGK